MQAPPDPTALHLQESELRRRLESQTRALDVLTQLTEQLVAIEDEGLAPAWRERLRTTLQARMAETEGAIQETREALAQLAQREGQS